MPSFRARLIFGTLAFALVVGALAVCGSAARALRPAIAAASVLPTPGSIHVTADDTVATLRWDGYGGWGAASPPGVAGYRVQWGPRSNPTQNSVLAQYPAVQLQPLTAGVAYQAAIQAIDAAGDLSAPSAPVTFQADGTRVAALRKQMTGFFDDFNLPEGFPDELKWNAAYSACDDPMGSSFFINAQFHVHSAVLSQSCDRAETIARPRATFDIGGRTGTLVFDLDGAFDRDQWYIDYVPTLMDITGQSSAGTGIADNPGPMLRLIETNNAVGVQVAGDDGVRRTVANSKDLRSYGIQTVPNVRLPWIVHLSQTHIEVQISGATVLSADLNLPFSAGTLLWTVLGYNSGKEEKPDALIHWDNFGFDAPTGATPAPVTHNYRTEAVNNADFTPLQGQTPVERDIVIPDSLAGATAARLMFTLQMPMNKWYSWTPNDRVAVNGSVFNVPQPSGPSDVPQSDLVSTIDPYSMVLPLDPALFVTGTNTLSFSMASAGLLNVHVEFDFPSNASPAYTQPAAIYGQADAAMPMLMSPAGPTAIFTSVGDVAAWTFMGGSPSSVAQHQQIVQGKTTLKYRVDEAIALSATGKVAGIAQVQILVDGQQVQTLATAADAPAPTVTGEYILDTTRLSNGVHTVEVVATDMAGTPSIPAYFESPTYAGSHDPVYLDVENGGGKS